MTTAKMKIAKTTSVVGIDYSMSSPAVCIHTGVVWSLDNCKFYFLTPKKRCTLKTKMFCGELHFPSTSQEERFAQLAEWTITKIPKNSHVFIEGYAYASKGVVFHIGENTGLLKHRLWSNNMLFQDVPPPTLKKFATGKGNANKMLMYESFIQDTQFDISAVINCKEGDSPMSDLIDAYYMAKYGFTVLLLNQ